jgi:hypothetical protein
MIDLPSFNTLAFEPFNIAVPDPAAGAGWNYIVPDNTILLIDAVFCLLITSAAALNRQVVIYISLTAPLIYDFLSTDIVVASQARRINIFPAASFYTSGGPTGRCLLPIPPNLYLRTFDQITVGCFAIDAADQFSDILIAGRRWTIF